jgi:formylglycine-generating enzyme required for sulfatase activity
MLALVTHSQGGLILQRFLAWMLLEGRGRDLAWIRLIVMLACPNEGSEYLRSIRAVAGFGHHPQAKALRVLDTDVGEARRVVLRQIINAPVLDERNCRIPFYVYSGDSDNVVSRESAQSVFPHAGVLPGDHFSILNPGASGNLTLPVLKRHLSSLSQEKGATQGEAIAAVTLDEQAAPRLTYRDTEFVYIPGGDFIMGTTERRAAELADTEGRAEFEDEAPRATCALPGFYISRFPVTNAQYAEFLGEDGGPVPFRADELSLPHSWDPGTRRYPDGMGDHPVVLVSWRQAIRYCRWLGVRLPTEAEWEKAARGTDAREWAWGNEWDADQCNTSEGGRVLASVGRFSPAGDSPYGVAEMSGTVWEWCSSLYDPYPYDAEDGREEQAAVGARVLRGGAWVQDRYLARCATRNRAKPDDYGFTIGFRVVMSSTPTSAAR